MTLTGWWRTQYRGAPWAGFESEGESLGRLLVGAHAPATGPALAGHDTAAFDGVMSHLVEDTHYLESYVDASQWWTGILATVDDAAPDEAAPYDDAALLSENNGGWGIAVSSGGARAWNYDGGFKRTPRVPIPFGGWAWVEASLAGGVLSVAVNGQIAQTVATGPLTAPHVRALQVGANWNKTKFFKGKIAEVMLSRSVPSETARAGLKSYLAERYQFSY